MSWIGNLSRALLTKGGVHPPENKTTSAMKIFPGPNPEVVVIPLIQHIGAPCRPIVDVHDEVLAGQKIGDSPSYVSAPVHSSVSGEVTGIIEHPHPNGTDVVSIQILSDRLCRRSENIELPPDPMKMERSEILKVIREGGIVGLGGATFPTHVKLNPPKGKKIELLIINGAECEPYLTADDRLMVERPEDIIKGALIIKRAVGAEKVMVGIEYNKPDAMRLMQEYGADFGIEVLPLPRKYPTGAEKGLTKVATGREVPCGGLPHDVGVIVQNVATAAAISDLFYEGIPLTERVLTVAGDGIMGHANLRVKIGTLVEDVIDYCGGFSGERGKLILGGPMMGIAQYTASVPVIKGTNGIIGLRKETASAQEPSRFVCIRCGRCVRRCPMNLMPYLMGTYSDAGLWEKLEGLNIDDCMECGCCAYICPTKNHLVQLIKLGKEELGRRKEKFKAVEGK